MCNIKRLSGRVDIDISKWYSQPYLLNWRESVENGRHMDLLGDPLMPMVLMTSELGQSTLLTTWPSILSAAKTVPFASTARTSLLKRHEEQWSVLKRESFYFET